MDQIKIIANIFKNTSNDNLVEAFSCTLDG